MLNVEGELYDLGGLEYEDVTYPGNCAQPEPSHNVKREIEQGQGHGAMPGTKKMPDLGT